MTVIDRIIDCLKKEGKQQNELASALKDKNVTKQTISDWKRGKSSSYYEMMPEIANFFGVSTDYLLGRTDTTSQMGMPDKKKEPNLRLIKEKGDLFMDGKKKRNYKEIAERIEKKLSDPNFKSISVRIKEAREILEISNDDNIMMLPLKEFLHFTDEAIAEENPELVEEICRKIEAQYRAEAMDEEQYELIDAFYSLSKSGQRYIWGMIEQELRSEASKRNDLANAVNQ